MPTIILTNPFEDDFFALTDIEQKRGRKAIRFLSDNPRNPSLQIHRIKGTDFWEAYVNKDIRIVFEQNSDTLILLAIGHHDIYKKFETQVTTLKPGGAFYEHLDAQTEKACSTRSVGTAGDSAARRNLYRRRS